MIRTKSDSMSFEGWNPTDFLKGQKKTIITLIGAGLGYFIGNNETIALLSALLFAGIISVAEYYFKKIRKV